MGAEMEAVQQERDRVAEELANTQQQLRGVASLLLVAQRSLQRATELEFDRSYSYNRHKVVRLSQLIARYLEDKPHEINANRIYNNVKNCYDDLQKSWADNPKHYHIDMRMLLTTCAASTWFSPNQSANIGGWLATRGWD